MNKFTLITCSYNTPEVTLKMLKSWAVVHNNQFRNVIIIENSTNSMTSYVLDKNNIDYVKNPGGTHGSSVNIALDKCETDYALLVDTDVVFHKNHEHLFNIFESNDLTLMGKVEGDRGGKHIRNRVNPWHCFINVKHLKKHNIKFFDETRFKEALQTDFIYDVGSTMFEDVHKLKLKIADMDFQGKYFTHYEGLSWYTNKYNPNKQDTHSLDYDPEGSHNNKALYDAGIQKMNHYQKQTAYLENTKLYIGYNPKLLVKFPTRNRTEKFFVTLDAYYNLLSGHHQVSFLISCDIDDISMNTTAVKNRLDTYNDLMYDFSDNNTKIEAINTGLDAYDFDIVLLASDDMIPQVKNYDDIIINDMMASFPEMDGVLWYNDGIQSNNLNTLCILGKKYYDKFGYIYHPSYKSLWCDAEFTEVSKKLSKVAYSDECIIKHEHHSTCNEQIDKLYQENEKYENEDKNTFVLRKKKGFPINDS